MAKLSMPRHVQEFLKSQGVPSVVRVAGRHPKVLFEVGEHRLMYTCAKTVSDWRAIANAQSDLRRMLRDAGIKLK